MGDVGQPASRTSPVPRAAGWCCGIVSPQKTVSRQKLDLGADFTGRVLVLELLVGSLPLFAGSAAYARAVCGE